MAYRSLRCSLAFTALVVTIGLCGCSIPFFDKKPSVDAAALAERSALRAQLAPPVIKQNGVLTVGIPSTATVPLCSRDGSSFSGIDVDVASAVAQNLGLKVAFVPTPNAKAGIEAGCDIVMDVPFGQTDGITVVGQYAESAAAFFGKRTSGVIGIDRLVGKTVGVQDNSTSLALLSKMGINVVQKKFNSVNDAMSALVNGTVDYVICDAYSGAYLAAPYPEIVECGTVDVPHAIGVGVAAANLDLQMKIQASLKIIQGNGIYPLIRSRWVGSMKSLTEQQKIQGLTVQNESSGTENNATQPNSAGQPESVNIASAGSNAIVVTN